MKKLAFLACSISLILVACDRNPPKPEASGNQGAAKDQAEPKDQAETEADRQLLQSIHRSLGNGNDAKTGFRVIVTDGNVTLKGSVKADHDKSEIESKIVNVEGVKSVSNHLEIQQH